MVVELTLGKMQHEPGTPVRYSWETLDGPLALNPLVGTRIRLELKGPIQCVHCGRAIKKTFSRGYCYPCFQKLARCDLCIVRPSRCHFDQGTCREEDWGREHCMIPHAVYLSVTSGLKVGITRAYRVGAYTYFYRGYHTEP